MSELGDRLRAQIAARDTKIPGTPRVYSAPVSVPWWSDLLPEVAPSHDLDRIESIPRREVTAEKAQVLVEQYTQRLKTPAGSMHLRPLQAQALHEAAEHGGLLGPIGVGEGKSLISLLAPVVMNSRRAVLLVPSSLKKRILKNQVPELSKHWKLPRILKDDQAPIEGECCLWIAGYGQISHEKYAQLLEEIAPDLIVCDEAHSVAQYTAARTKRFMRYFRNHPGTRAVLLSGTLISRSIKEGARLSGLALGSNSPYPKDWRVLDEWSRVLDPNKDLADGDREAAAGELRRLCRPDESVRSGFRRRVVETPGVVASTENTLGVSLRLIGHEVDIPKCVSDALQAMADTWETPWGEVITDALSYYRYARQLAAGLNYVRVWPRDEPTDVREEWLEARSEWHREVRTQLRRASRPGADSPKLLAIAASTGRWESSTWARWDAIRNQARPETRDVWLSDYLCQNLAVEGQKKPSVIWYEHRAFGERLASVAGFKRYPPGDSTIELDSGDGTVLASIAGHGTGFNLQQWSRQWVVSPPSSAKTWEQLLGRLHRHGQRADTVETFVCLQSQVLRKSFADALVTAKFLEDTTGNRQKLLYADAVGF